MNKTGKRSVGGPATDVFLALLRDAVVNSSLNNRKFARNIGIPQSLLSVLLSGKRSGISLETAIRAAKATGISLDSLKEAQSPRSL